VWEARSWLDGIGLELQDSLSLRRVQAGTRNTKVTNRGLYNTSLEISARWHASEGAEHNMNLNVKPGLRKQIAINRIGIYSSSHDWMKNIT
jgi:hypothetical protein